MTSIEVPHHRRDDRHEGYVYVLEFTTGTIKVGYTTSPADRFRTHSCDAVKFGAAISRHWLSPRHAAFCKNEAVLIQQAARSSDTWATEYFPEADFDELVRFAKMLDFTPMSAAQHAEIDAADAALHAFWTAGWGLNAMPNNVYIPNSNVAWLVQLMFGGPSHWMSPPSKSGDAGDASAILEALATMKGCTLDELQSWTWIDAFRDLLTTQVTIAAQSMTIWSYEANQPELRERIWGATEVSA